VWEEWLPVKTEAKKVLSTAFSLSIVTSVPAMFTGSRGGAGTQSNFYHHTVLNVNTTHQPNDAK